MSFSISKDILEKLSFKEFLLQNFVTILENAKKYQNRIWLVGNGGSASVMSHFTSDLLSLGFDAICLTDNISRLTALINDNCWDVVYALQLKHFKPSDILIIASVHGGTESSSQNLQLAAIEAKRKEGKVLSFLGCDGGRLKDFSDVYLLVPSNSACYVEGFHSLLCHMICDRLKQRNEK